MVWWAWRDCLVVKNTHSSCRPPKICLLKFTWWLTTICHSRSRDAVSFWFPQTPDTHEFLLHTCKQKTHIQHIKINKSLQNNSFFKKHISRILDYVCPKSLMMTEKSSLRFAVSSGGFCSYAMPHCILLPAWMDFVAMPCHTALLESRLQPEFTQSKSTSDKETQLLGNISEHEIHIDLMSNRKGCSSEIYSVVLNIKLNVIFLFTFLFFIINLFWILP